MFLCKTPLIRSDFGGVLMVSLTGFTICLEVIKSNQNFFSFIIATRKLSSVILRSVTEKEAVTQDSDYSGTEERCVTLIKVVFFITNKNFTQKNLTEG